MEAKCRRVDRPGVCVCVFVCIKITETLSHILNGCYACRGMYIARHDRIVELIAKDVSKYLLSTVRMYKHSRAISSMFHLCDNPDIFTSLTANRM